MQSNAHIYYTPIFLYYQVRILEFSVSEGLFLLY